MKTNNQEMTFRQTVCLMILFLMGNSALFGINQSGGRDSWITFVVAGAVSLLIAMLYASILRLGSGKSFFENLTALLGRVGGWIVTLLFVWYCLHLSALLMRTLSEFQRVSSLEKPPYLLILIFFTLVGVYLSRSEESVMGRWALILFVFILGMALFIVTASIKDVKLHNLLPILRRSPTDLARSSLWYLSFPFLECVVFLPLLARRSTQQDTPRIFRHSILWSGGILLTMLLINLLLLGEPMLNRLYFQTHSAAKLIHVGEFLSRMEEIISIFLLLSGVTRFTVCLRVACEGISHLLGSSKPSELAAPVGILAFALSMFSVNNIMDMENLLELYPFYSWIFQLGLPLVVWSVFKYKNRKKNPPLTGTEA